MVFAFKVSCDKEDNDVKAVENMLDWYTVGDKPKSKSFGFTKMYKYYDMTIFVFMIHGQGKERGMDAYGGTYSSHGMFDMGYYVYGLTRMGSTRHPLTR